MGFVEAAPAGLIQRSPATAGQVDAAQADAAQAGVAAPTAGDPEVDEETEKALKEVDPATAFELATSGTPSPMPLAGDMAAAFGTDFSDVEAHVGTPEAKLGLAILEAEAATVGRKVVFMDEQPSKEVVMHEATHLVQAEAGGANVTPKGVSSPDQATEREASAVAEQSSALGSQASVNPEARAAPGTVHRSLFGGILGGVLGAVGGAVAGFFVGGPLGAIAGGIAGAVGGAALGDRLSTARRGLTSAEIAYARDVYGDSIDYGPIEITRDSMASTGAPKTLGNTMHLVSNWGGAIFKSGDDNLLTNKGMELMIHEMGHVWQYQNGGLAYIGDSLWSQLKGWISGGSRNAAYDWRSAHDAGLAWNTWNPEQQAEAIEHYNTCLRAANTTPPTASTDQYNDLKILKPYMEKVRAGEGAPQFSAAGAVGGGLAGAGMGALVGGAVGGPVGALVGAGVGAIGGALFGGG